MPGAHSSRGDFRWPVSPWRVELPRWGRWCVSTCQAGAWQGSWDSGALSPHPVGASGSPIAQSPFSLRGTRWVGMKRASSGHDVPAAGSGPREGCIGVTFRWPSLDLRGRQVMCQGPVVGQCLSGKLVSTGGNVWAGGGRDPHGLEREEAAPLQGSPPPPDLASLHCRAIVPLGWQQQLRTQVCSLLPRPPQPRAASLGVLGQQVAALDCAPRSSEPGQVPLY